MTDKPNDWRERFQRFYYHDGEYAERAHGFQVYVEFIQSEMEEVEKPLKKVISDLRTIIVANDSCGCNHCINKGKPAIAQMNRVLEAQAKSGGEA